MNAKAKEIIRDIAESTTSRIKVEQLCEAIYRDLKRLASAAQSSTTGESTSKGRRGTGSTLAPSGSSATTRTIAGRRSKWSIARTRRSRKIRKRKAGCEN